MTGTTASPGQGWQPGRLLRTASAGLLARVIGALGGLGLQVVIARLLGVTGSGGFFTALTLMTVCALVGKLGLDTFLIRTAGPAWSQQRPGETARLFANASLTCAIAATSLSFVLWWLASPLTSRVLEWSELELPLRLAALTIPPFALIWVQAGALKAMLRPTLATVLEICILPVLALTILLGVWAWGEVTLAAASGAYLLATVGTAIIGAWLAARPLAGHGPRWRSVRPTLNVACVNLTGIELVNFALASAAIPLLGALATAADAGIYNAANRLVAQIATVGFIIGGMLAPRFASLYQGGDLARMASLAVQGARLMTLLGVPALIVLILFPEIISLLFGEAFAPAHACLQVLAIGQLFNLLTGPAGYLMVMTGHDAAMRNVQLATAALAIPLTALLAARHGHVGAAAGTAIGLALQNLACLMLVRRHHGFWLLPLSSGLPRRETA